MISAAVLSATVLSSCGPVLYLVNAVRRARAPVRSLALGAPARGDTSRGGDERYHPSCRGLRRGEDPAAADHAWRFVAPRDGRYRVRAHGAFDAVVAVFREGDDEELACNDDAEAGASLDAQVVLTLRAGQQYAVVVDGYRGDRGSYELTAQPAAPSDSEDPPAVRRLVDDPVVAAERCRAPRPLPEGLSTGLFSPGSGLLAPCGGTGTGLVFSFEAPHAGTLSVRQVSPWPAAVELRSGCGSESTSLVCEAHRPGRPGVELEVPLRAGRYTLVLDAVDPSRRGPFALDVRFTRETARASGVSAGDGDAGLGNAAAGASAADGGKPL